MRGSPGADAGGHAAPRHVAIVMDGNGRWAARRGGPRVYGHNAGMNAMTEIVRHASDVGVRYLTVYAFSTENWKRAPEEVSGIFGLLVKFVGLKLRELVENDVVVSVIGDYSPLPEDAKAALERTIADTSANTGMRFIIALNYGSRADILNAAKRLALDAASGAVRASELSESDLAARLSTAGVPDPDLVIRTSGEKRLSNFLLWEAAYSELVFSDVLWPDFTPEEFDRCVEEYARRDRRYGGRK
jgi:undecaprenyl diphosphate synthase